MIKKLILNNKKSPSSLDYSVELEKLLTSSINDMLISDKPVGAFLSGGIDSTLICGYYPRKQKKIKTFTIGFENKNYDSQFMPRKYLNYLNQITMNIFLIMKILNQ